MALKKVTLRYPVKDRPLYQQLQHMKERVNSIVDWANTLDISESDNLTKVGETGTPDYLSSEHFERTSERHIRLRNRAFRHGMLSHLSVDDHTQYLLANGTRALTGDWDAGSQYIQATRFISDVAIGTSPLTVTSTTLCANLNADQVDGCDSIDEDNMVSDSNVHVPTQQSVKAYVDAQVAGAYAFKTITGITNDVVADAVDDSLTLSSGNSILGIVGTAASDTITFTIDQSQIDHGSIAGLTDDDHTQYIKHSLSTAANDFLVGSGSNTFIKKTLAETGAILEGDINHDNLQGFVANEHIDWTTQTTSAVLTTGCKILDTNQSNSLNLVWNEDDTSDRTMNLYVNAGNRNFYLYGDLSVEAGASVSLNQDTTSDADVTFAGLDLGDEMPETTTKCSASANSEQTISDATWTLIQCNAEDFDNGSDYNTGTYTYTAPVTGTYLCVGHITWKATTENEQYYAAIYTNGYIRAQSIAHQAYAGAVTATVVSIESVAASQTIQLYGYQNTGGNALVDDGDQRTYLQVHLLSV